ncbi:MAG: ribbon-helix-helix domain-containing protein [Proteobacteria bacterium]|nr:ribbon-helix-helix domain-containing protein [Pseudomonadota bacterium]
MESTSVRLQRKLFSTLQTLSQKTKIPLTQKPIL